MDKPVMKTCMVSQNGVETSNNNNDKRITKERQPNSYHRLTLPGLCVAFGSSEGKSLFQQALLNGCLECYFCLAEQYRTQEEATFCGLSTLTMVINTLLIDPGKIWMGRWRWYHESFLDCCVPLEEIRNNHRGVSIDEMASIARCNGCDVKLVFAQDSTLEDFRNVVRSISRQTETFLVCSYDRGVVDQVGQGHYSPIGGFHEGEDMCMILDVSRYKYPAHWIKLNILWEAMMKVAPNGKTRGYLLMSRSPVASSIFFHVFKRPVVKDKILQFFNLVHLHKEVIRCKERGSSKNITQQTDWVNYLITCPQATEIVTVVGEYLMETTADEQHTKRRDLLLQLLSELEDTEIFKVVHNCIKSSYCCQYCISETIPLVGLAKPEHLLSILLLIIPRVHWEKSEETGKYFFQLLDPTGFPELLRKELNNVKRQLNVICGSQNFKLT